MRSTSDKTDSNKEKQNKTEETLPPLDWKGSPPGSREASKKDSKENHEIKVEIENDRLTPSNNSEDDRILLEERLQKFTSQILETRQYSPEQTANLLKHLEATELKFAELQPTENASCRAKDGLTVSMEVEDSDTEYHEAPSTSSKEIGHPDNLDPPEEPVVRMKHDCSPPKMPTSKTQFEDQSNLCAYFGAENTDTTASTKLNEIIGEANEPVYMSQENGRADPNSSTLIAAGMLGPLCANLLEDIPFENIKIRHITYGYIEFHLKNQDISDAEFQNIRNRISKILRPIFQPTELYKNLGVFEPRVYYLESFIKYRKYGKVENFKITENGKNLLMSSWFCIEHFNCQLILKFKPGKQPNGKKPFIPKDKRKEPDLRKVSSDICKELVGKKGIKSCSGLIDLFADLKGDDYDLVFDVENAVIMLKHRQNIYTVTFDIQGPDYKTYAEKNIVELGQNSYLFMEKVFAEYKKAFGIHPDL